MEGVGSLQYRHLSLEECENITTIDRSEYIEHAWRKVDGYWQLKRIDWQETDWPGDVESYISALKNTIQAGGVVLGAYDEDLLVGVASVNRSFFGSTWNYVLLDNMFVSRSSRGKGIGKKLVRMCAEQAREWGADKLYACAASSEATIAFYRGLGFEDAKEVNQELYELDPRDIQLELDLKR